MELILELIYEIVIEGSFAIIKDKNNPLLLRIALLLFLTIIYVALISLGTFLMIKFWKQRDWVATAILAVIDFGIIVLSFFGIIKAIKGRNI